MTTVKSGCIYFELIMIKKIISCFLLVLCAHGAWGEDGVLTYYDVVNRASDDTQCASGVFAKALRAAAGDVHEDDDETVIQAWIYKTFAKSDVLTEVLACPEIANAPDNKAIKFIPIQYEFENGRKIVVNYEVTPHVLKQRLLLANKPPLPNESDSPRIGEAGDETIWTNVDPAWYAIMVVEHGALDEFAGQGKNNTISLNYIIENIDSLYPKGWSCTSKSAWANDSDAINESMHKTVGLEDAGQKDPNDYYVAGDMNLAWVSYAEIALDITLMIATYGASAAVSGGIKGAQIAKVTRPLMASLKSLRQVASVQDYMRAMREISRVGDALKVAQRAKDADKIKDLTQQLKNLQQTAKELEKIKDVAKYKETSESIQELGKLKRQIGAMRGVRGAAKLAKRGNVFTRVARAIKGSYKAIWSGNKAIRHGAKLARSSNWAGRVRDWLFHSTLRSGATLARVTADTSLLYGAVKFVGDMYDYTSDTTDQYTNGEDFKPLLLLSADDIEGADNVVNYGMWLMWAGDSVSPADDDAAYLQAMDFAAKFHQDLLIYQDGTNSPCDIDIYVVRPIIRNPGTDSQALYYLIMNDVPWSTNM